MIRTTLDCASLFGMLNEEFQFVASLVGLVPARLMRSHSRAWSAVAVL